MWQHLVSNFGERWIYDSFSKSHVINDSSRATNVGLPVVSRQAKIIRWDWSMNMCHPYWNWNFTYIRDTYICHQLSQFREIGDSSSQPNQVSSILKRDTVFFFFFFFYSPKFTVTRHVTGSGPVIPLQTVGSRIDCPLTYCYFQTLWNVQDEAINLYTIAISFTT